MASIAVRVEIGDDHDSGVARSSRAGTKRSVKAGPTNRFCPGTSGRVPRSQTFRNPFFKSTVVMVAVDTCDNVAMACGVRDIEQQLRWDEQLAAHLAIGGDGVKSGRQTSCIALDASSPISAAYRDHAD
jgi:hypothetical protein